MTDWVQKAAEEIVRAHPQIVVDTKRWGDGWEPKVLELAAIIQRHLPQVHTCGKMDRERCECSLCVLAMCLACIGAEEKKP
jgi:hypothetical protein